jgi:nicotinate-nucleotide--dimethylbenzimidazole phosphoribosyltransferase
MSVSCLPFDDIRELMAQLPPADDTAGRIARERATAISAAFCTVDEDNAGTAEWLARWSGKSPKVSRPVLALFAGTHKVCEHYGGAGKAAPGEPALSVVTRLAAGGSPANQVCASADIGLKAFDLALQYPVEDITFGEAMDEKGSAATIGFGMEAIAGGVDILGLSAFGQGSEIASAVILTILLGGEPDDWLVMPAGSGEAARNVALDTASKAVTLHQSARGNPLELLRRAGGREFSAIAGAILSARTQHVPVVTGGMTALAVLCLLEAQQAGAGEHCRHVLTRSDTVEERAAAAGGVATIASEFSGYVDGSGVAATIAQIRLMSEIHSGTVLSQDD